MTTAASFLWTHPGLEEALKTDHRISLDLAQKLQSYGSLSAAQVALAFKLANEASSPRLQEAHVPAPVGSGRIRIAGTVVSRKTHSSQYGETEKVTIKVTTPAGSWLCWGSVPSSNGYVEGWFSVGSQIAFDAALVAGNDAHFAFFKRPTKAESAAPAAVAA